MADGITATRRRLCLGGGALAVAALAGCFDLAGDSTNRIEPEDPGDSREGTPAEFYFFLEQNGVEVDELTRDEDVLNLTYTSAAETREESNSEIDDIYQIFARALIARESGVERLIATVSNPFDEQAHGWGILAEWIDHDDPDEPADRNVLIMISSTKVDGDGEALLTAEPIDDAENGSNVTE